MELFRIWIEQNTQLMREVIPDVQFSMELVQTNVLQLTLCSNEHNDIVLTVTRAGPWFNVASAETQTRRIRYTRRVPGAETMGLPDVLRSAIALQSE